MEDLNYRKLPIIVSITGASGIIYGIRTLQFLLENNYKVELVISESACKVAAGELNLHLSNNETNRLKEQVLSYLKIPFQKSTLLNVWDYNDVSASISSGSYKTLGMLIIPASMGTVGAIASGTSDNLITRAADVCLKEKRKLVIVPREMPLSTIHLENLLKLSTIGAVVAPASPAFYHNPEEILQLIDFVVGKALDLFEIDHSLFKRWQKQSGLVINEKSLAAS